MGINRKFERKNVCDRNQLREQFKKQIPREDFISESFEPRKSLSENPFFTYSSLPCIKINFNHKKSILKLSEEVKFIPTKTIPYKINQSLSAFLQCVEIIFAFSLILRTIFCAYLIPLFQSTTPVFLCLLMSTCSLNLLELN